MSPTPRAAPSRPPGRKLPRRKAPERGATPHDAAAAAAGLADYAARRAFDLTPEPPPEAAPQRIGPLLFVVQQHAARRMHWDFRLELDGVLKSWAVPKAPSLDPADRRLAVQVEDHPLE